MSIGSLAAFFLVFAILLVMAIVAEVFTDEIAKPKTLFGYLAISTLVSGITTTIVTEKLGARVLV